MDDAAPMPFFMQSGAAGGSQANAVATHEAGTNGGAGPAPDHEVISVVDDDEDDVAIQAGIHVTNNMVHRVQSNVSLGSIQSSASNKSANQNGHKVSKRKTLTDEKAIANLSALHGKGKLALQANVSIRTAFVVRSVLTRSFF